MAAIAVVMDGVALWARAPAMVGIPLLVVVAVPSFVEATLADPLFFGMAAVVYLFIIRGRFRRIQSGVAFAVGAFAVLGALILPLLLPPVTPGVVAGAPGGILAETVNPIIDLGADLRRTTAVPALSYTTTSATGEYLRLATLENFVGEEWAPEAPQLRRQNRLSAIGAAPGLTKAVDRQTVTTDITVGNTSSRWLPVPYPPTRITGLSGQWSWEPEALAVGTLSSNIEGQKYVVKSLDVEPTRQQLEEAPPDPQSPLAVVPKGLDPIIAATAKTVVGAAKTDFDKAIALQNWFRGGTFTYSLNTPALAGFDGSGLDVIVPFLQAKSGYCVHFATAMAIMARTLGIPSRIAVGFLPGKASHPVGNAPSTVFNVTSDDLHSWPELYFRGIGWVRFEPTPSKGFEPDFPDAPSSALGPSATNAPSAGVASTPTPAPNSQAHLPADSQPVASNSGGASGAASAAGWGLLALLIFLAALIGPGIARLRMRGRRLAAIRAGRASAALTWQELRDSARDLGLDARSSATPRELSNQLARYLSGGLSATPAAVGESLTALRQLRALIERESYTREATFLIGESMAERLSVVLHGLRRVATPGARLRALLLPVTIVDLALGRRAVRV